MLLIELNHILNKIFFSYKDHFIIIIYNINSTKNQSSLNTKKYQLWYDILFLNNLVPKFLTLLEKIYASYSDLVWWFQLENEKYVFDSLYQILVGFIFVKQKSLKPKFQTVLQYNLCLWMFWVHKGYFAVKKLL